MTTKADVYFIELAGMRRIVAAPSRSHAATLLQISTHILKTHGGCGVDGDEHELALSDQGAVFGYAEGSDGWVKLTSSKRSRMLPANGGYRAGGGKPREAKTLAACHTLRLSDDDFETFQKLGGVSWLRKKIRTSEVDQDRKWHRRRGAGEFSVRSVRLCAEDYANFLSLGGILWLRHMLSNASASNANKEQAA